MAGAFSLGHLLATPVLARLTDRFDPRLVLIAGSGVSSFATIVFGIFADDLMSAILIWGLAGMGFAGADMSASKVLTDRLSSTDNSCSITLSSVGLALSFLVAQLVAKSFGWRAAFYVTGIDPLIMLAVAAALAPSKSAPTDRQLLDLTPVLQNPGALRFIIGYGGYCFARNAIHTWLIAFWTFVIVQNDGVVPLGAVSVSVMVALLGIPASIMENKVALHYGRRRAVTVIMTSSAMLALAIGYITATTASPLQLLALVLLYCLISADTAGLTLRTGENVAPVHRSTAATFNSMVGCAFSSLGAFLSGVALDVAGGPTNPAGWSEMFALVAIAILLGPLALMWSTRTK
jgi:MFS family permease